MAQVTTGTLATVSPRHALNKVSWYGRENSNALSTLMLPLLLPLKKLQCCLINSRQFHTTMSSADLSGGFTVEEVR